MFEAHDKSGPKIILVAVSVLILIGLILVLRRDFSTVTSDVSSPQAKVNQTPQENLAPDPGDKISPESNPAQPTTTVKFRFP